MHFTPLIKVVVPKCRFTVEREGNVRNRFTSSWGYPVFFKRTCYPSCCVGHMVTLRHWKGCWPASVRDLLWVLGRRWRTWFPIGRLYKVQKGSYTVFLQGDNDADRKEGEKRCFQRQRLERFSGGESCSPKMGRAWLCAWQEGGQSSLLLSAGQRVLVALWGKKG